MKSIFDFLNKISMIISYRDLRYDYDDYDEPAKVDG